MEGRRSIKKELMRKEIKKGYKMETDERRKEMKREE